MLKPIKVILTRNIFAQFINIFLMASKGKTNAGSGPLKRPDGVLISKIKKDLLHGSKAGSSLNPLLMPEKIKGPKGDAVISIPYDNLDMKSKKLINSIDESLTSLSAVNPLEEGGFGYDHPAVKGKKVSKKKDKSFSQAEAVENIDEYSAILLDLKSIMGKLSLSREHIFNGSAKKNMSSPD